MEALETLGPEALRATMVAYRDALRAHQDRLNRLNVYPVPDGDTGTNMALTLESVVAGLDDAAPGDVARAVTHGSLMGARGNSGVILSQILKGLADGLAGGAGPAGAEGVAAALRAASVAADLAVMHPVEGTILTVARDAAKAAEGDTVVAVLESASAAAARSLEETPKLLAVLAEAGVVDAGGAGYVLLLDALLHVADGRPLPAPEDDPSFLSRATPLEGHRRDENGGEGGRYEVMYFLEGPDEGVEPFKAAWDTIGDSIVVVGGEGLWNCHIHTDDIGAAVEAALDTGGRPRRIRVTDLHQQVADEAHHRTDGAVEPAPAPTHVTTAVVAVGAGAGLTEILRSLGVQVVVAGGQSMNPSTAQIVAAIEATAADAVIVLPDNKNVVPVAEQAAGLGSKPARVVATRSVAEGLASLLAYDAAADVDVNVAAMVEAAKRVAWGEITRAVRDAVSTPAGPVKDGDWLGLDHGSIAVAEADLATAACALLDRLVDGGHEIVTVIEGEGATGEATGAVRAWLAEHRPGVTVEVHDGGQPLAAYLFSAE
ncbi:MAG: DAK2 domain-containing protein [Actinomycetota bacterium]|nr:DAK2 domain-containing protein [Actinomycetota bacterium]